MILKMITFSSKTPPLKYAFNVERRLIPQKSQMI